MKEKGKGMTSPPPKIFWHKTTPGAHLSVSVGSVYLSTTAAACGDRFAAGRPAILTASVTARPCGGFAAVGPAGTEGMSIDSCRRRTHSSKCDCEQCPVVI